MKLISSILVFFIVVEYYLVIILVDRENVWVFIKYYTQIDKGTHSDPLTYGESMPFYTNTL